MLRSLAALGLLLAMASPACQAATNTTAVQCASEAECLSLGPDFAGTTCDPATKTCIKVAADSDLCTSNQSCVDKAGGLAAICRKSDRKCVTLQTPECPTVYAKAGQIVNDNAIVIGAITPAAAAELGDVMEAAMALAQSELSTVVPGLPAPDGSSNARPLVILSCREFSAGGQAAMIRAANHLVKDVGVPLVIGPIDGGNAVTLLGAVFAPTKTLDIPPVLIVSSAYDIPSPIAPTPILWSAAITDKGAIKGQQEFITKVIVPRLQSEGVTGPIKVALLYDDTPFGNNQAQVWESVLNINGKNAADNAMAGNYARISIGNSIDPVSNPAPETKFDAAIAQVIAFKPNIIIHGHPPDAIPPVLFNLALAWPAGLPFAYHIDTSTTFAGFSPLYDFLSAFPPLRGRVFSEEVHVSDDEKARRDQFLIRFQTANPAFRGSPVPTFNIVHDWYDSLYMAAYAIVATRTKPLTGENIAATLPLLQPPGQLIRTGPDDIAKAFALLNSGQGIDLDGISGNMNLDTRNGAPSPDYDIQVLCPTADPASGRIVGFGPSGFFTQGGVGTGTVTGCPPPFPTGP